MGELLPTKSIIIADDELCAFCASDVKIRSWGDKEQVPHCNCMGGNGHYWRGMELRAATELAKKQASAIVEKYEKIMHPHPALAQLAGQNKAEEIENELKDLIKP